MTDQEKLEELARVQRMIEEVEEWGYGTIELEIQDGQIVIGQGTKWSKKYKFNK